jgi:peptide/nickel transport system permease protein
VIVQYLAWLGNALRGDFGYSYTQRRPVTDILKERFPRSMELAFLTILVAIVWAIPLGVISAVRQNTWADYLVRVLSISGLSLPIFFTGVLILYGLSRFFRWIPPLEFVAFSDNPVENLKQLIWPTLAQAYYISAPITRLTRSQMLEVIRHDYIRTARAKGLTEEIIFVVPGMGTALVQAVSYRDYPTVQAIVFMMALVFMTINLLVDLLYAWLDPRIRYA